MTRVLSLCAGAMVACAPNLGTDDWLVTGPQILAVKADPPEAKPGAQATYTALVATPIGDAVSPDVTWRWCVAPKPLTENGAVSSACLDASSLMAAGAGASVVASSPTNACALFGPDTPPGGFRPRDPDPTGGYYQPLRAAFGGAPIAFDLARLECNLANASADIATAFAKAYVPNANPHLSPLVATVAGRPASLDAIPPGAGVALEASWPPGDAETFAYFDQASQTVTTQREAMRVAWYVTAGVLSTESTGRDADDPATTTDNVWVAPSLGTATLWLVLRDSRGGVDYATYAVTVAP